MKSVLLVGTGTLVLIAFAGVRVWYANFREVPRAVPSAVSVGMTPELTIRETRSIPRRAGIARPASPAIPARHSDTETSVSPVDAEANVESNARFERDSAEDETRRLRESTVLDR